MRLFYLQKGENMQNCWIVFASSTSAGRLKRLALSSGLSDVKIVQAPKTISQNGCTYALTFSPGSLAHLLELADSYKIRHGFVYQEQNDANGNRYFKRIE